MSELLPETSTLAVAQEERLRKARAMLRDLRKKTRL